MLAFFRSLFQTHKTTEAARKLQLAEAALQECRLDLNRAKEQNAVLEEQLDRKTAVLNDLMHKNPYSVQIFDAAGYSRKFNQATVRMFGSGPPPGYNLFEDANLQRDQIAARLKSLKGQDCLEIKGGSYNPHDFSPDLPDKTIYMHSYAFPIADASGETEAIVVIHEDITDSRTNEQELRRSEARYRAIFENTGSASILIDANTMILLANSEWYSMTGFSHEDVSNKMSWTAFVMEEDRERMLNYHHIRRREPGSVPNDYEFRMRTKDGLLKYIVIRVAMIPGSQVSIASLHDVTDRKNAEEKFRLAFNSAPIPMTLAEAELGPYVEVNDAGLAFSGFSREELVGRCWNELRLFNPADEKDIISRIKRERRIRDMEVEFRVKSSQVKQAILNVDLVAMEGKTYVLATMLDITYRKNIERALQDSEERFRLFAENALDGFVIIRENRFVYVNPAICRMVGYTEAEMRAFHDMTAIAADTAGGKALIGENHAARRHGQLHDEPYEAQFLHKDGRTVIDVLLSPALVDYQGENHIFLLVKDITKRVQVEKALKASEEKYRSLFAHTPAGVVNYDRDLIVTDFNERFAEIMESSQERILGLDMHDLKEQVVLTVLNKAIQGQEGFYEGIYRATTSNAQKWIFLHTAPLYAADGSLVGGIGIVEDTSPRREAEKERDRLRFLLENIVDSMPSLLVGIDGQSRVTQWNRGARVLTGYNEFEVLGRNVEEVLPLVRKLRGQLEKALAEKSIQQVERLPFVEKGEQRFAAAVIYPLAGDDGMAGAVIRMDEITEQVRLEEIMIQTEKMMSVGGMAAGMAHEINNPLGGVLQGAQNVLRRLETGNEQNRRVAEESGTSIEAVRQYAERRQIMAFIEGIRSSGVRASNIVSNMLQFSRGSSRKKQNAGLASLLENALELAGSDYDLNKNYDFRHIKIKRNYDDSLPDVLCSPVEIEQVVFNILKNAAQAFNDKAKTPQILLQTRREGDWAVIEIADNGPGMSETVRRRIFEPFYTTKPTGGGTGLGLAVSYFIITNNHRGQIYVDSVPGEGTVFIIRLPVLDSPELLESATML